MSVVHCQKQDYDVYIGRGKCPKTGKFSRWANPFKIGPDGDRDQVIEKYEIYLNSRPELLTRIVEDLRDKVLGCYCNPLPCHGDILARYSNANWIVNWFSNMLPLDEPFIYQGTRYNTSENFYQAMKLPKDRVDLRKKIAAMTPCEAKKAIKSRQQFRWREDWTDTESLKVMEYILKVKFDGKNWRRKLLLSKDYELVEWNNWGDNFWGCNPWTGEGNNNLGKILMKIRDDVQNN